MWKKQWTVMTTIMLAAGALAACGSDSDEKKPAASGGGDDAKPNVTVRFHAQNATFDKTMMAPVIAKFEEKNPGVKIDFVGMTEPTSDEVTKKIDLLAASGEPLDVILLADARSYSQRAANGMLEPLDKFIQKEGFKFEDEYKTDTKWNGSYYALPGTFNQWFVIMNKNHLDEAGLKVPTVEWTWDDYLDYAKKLTKGEGASKRYGTYYHSWADYFLLGMWNQPGKNDIVWTDGSLNMDHPGVRKSLEIRQRSEITDKSAIPYADAISQKIAYRPIYFNQSVSMMAIGSWMIGEVGGTDQFPSTFKTVFAPMPRNSQSDPAGHAMSSSNYLAIASTSKQKEAAYQFLRFFSTEGLTMMQKYTTSWKKEDTSKLLDAIIGATKTPQNVDKESLLYVLNNTKPVTLPPALPYQAEVYKLYQEEVEKMLLGQQDIAASIAGAKTKLQKLVDANKK